MRKGLPKPYGLVACAFLASTAYGQTPGSIDPGRIGERFEQPPAPPAPLLAASPATAATASAAPDEARFVLSSVRVEGSTVYPASTFAPLYRGWIGQSVSLSDMQRIADAITDRYAADGYPLSVAIVPQQQVTDGAVTIRVTEGYIADVKVEGQMSDRRDLILRTAENVMRSRPVRSADLERYLLLVNDLPGVSASVALRPDGGQGRVTLVLHVTQTRFDGLLAADNRGSEAIGPVQLWANVDANSLLGLDERTSILGATTSQTRELAYLAIRHEETLNTEGLRLVLSGSVSRSRPGGSLRALDALGKGEAYGVRLIAPLVRTRARSFAVGVGFDYLNATTDVHDDPYSEDRVRFVSVDGTLDTVDTALGHSRPATTRLQGALSHGLDVFDATKTGSPGLSRPGGESDFTKLNVELTRIQTLTPQLSAAVAVSAQVAGGPLLASQQFGLGGARFGRGYEPSELTGDIGAAISIEGRYAPPLDLPLVSEPQLYAFYDAGAVESKLPPAGMPKSDSLSSAGAGVRFSIADRISVQFELTKPLSRPVASSGDKDVRPLFYISTRF